MGRGDDRTSPHPTQPKRNPFRQEIRGIKQENDSSSQEKNQEPVSPEAPLTTDEAISQEAGEVADVVRRAAVSYYLSLSSNPKTSDSEDPAKVKSLLDNLATRLSLELSEKLAELAGDDLLLAEKLENIVQQSESGLFAKYSYDNYRQRVFSKEGLERLARNIERTWILHKKELS